MLSSVASLFLNTMNMYKTLHQSVIRALFAGCLLSVTLLSQQKPSAAVINPESIASTISSEYLIAGIKIDLSSRPFAHNAKFNTNAIEQMYRGSWVNGQWKSADTYPGGLAGAIRRQLSTGELVGGVDHLPKGQQRLDQLKTIITNEKIGTESLDSYDVDLARALHDDLLNALQNKPIVR